MVLPGILPWWGEHSTRVEIIETSFGELRKGRDRDKTEERWRINDHTGNWHKEIILDIRI